MTCIYRSTINSWRFTVCENRYKEDGEILPLSAILKALPEKYSLEIEAARDGLKKGDATKKHLLPIWYPGGIYSGAHRSENLLRPNNLICLDLDAKDNPGKGVNHFRTLAKNCPFVAAYSVSCSGTGLFMLVPLPEDSADEGRFRGYFNALKAYFLQYGYVIDRVCSNSNRGRYLSFDPDARISDYAIVWEDCEPDPQPAANCDEDGANLPNYYDRPRLYMEVEAVVQECERRGECLAQTPGGWYGLACSITKILGEDGRPLFLRLSRVWERTTGRRQEIDPGGTYTNALHPKGGNKARRGKFFKIAEGRGIYVKSHRRRVRY